MNESIRLLLQMKRVRQWEIAEAIGVSEPTLCRMLRKELTDEQKKKIVSVVNDIAKKHYEAISQCELITDKG